MVLEISKEELSATSTGWRFEGYNFNDTNVSFYIIEAAPGKGTKLHRHPYEEAFITLEGKATFTIGDETFEKRPGQIVIAPANTPYKFINSGDGILCQIDIHPLPKMEQYNLE
jgi:mannose-6-phosphate isomerase-like protein (cupin superfamily)